MRKIIAAVSLAVLPMTGAFAGTVAANDSGGYDFTATAAGTDFVQTDFSFTLSNNVTLLHAEDGTGMVVQTVAPKGSFAYAGSSEGGAVATCGDRFDGAANVTALGPDVANLADGGCHL